MIHGLCPSCDESIRCIDVFTALSNCGFVSETTRQRDHPNLVCPACVLEQTGLRTIPCSSCLSRDVFRAIWSLEHRLNFRLTFSTQRRAPNGNLYTLSTTPANDATIIFWKARDGAAYSSLLFPEYLRMNGRDPLGAEMPPFQARVIPDGLLACHCNNCR